MPERMRETLLPFVLMLGHSADDSEVENKRYKVVFDQTLVKLMLPFAKKCSDQQLIGVCEIHSEGALLLKIRNKRWRGVHKLAQVGPEMR
jgi:hypothetical protein